MMPHRSWRSRVHAITAAFRFQKMLQVRQHPPLQLQALQIEEPLRPPLRRTVRVYFYLAVATVRLRHSRAQARRQALLRRFRSYTHAIVFAWKLTSTLRQKHIQCFPLRTALDIIAEGFSIKLDQALNSGKCAVFLHLFSCIRNQLHIMEFVLDNLKLPLKVDGYKGLSAYYYTLKGLCQLLLMSKQYIQDCTGFLPSRQVFAKLENINTTEFLVLEVYRSYQLVALRFEGFVSTISDPLSQEAHWNCEPSSSTGLYVGHYLRVQAHKDLQQVLERPSEDGSTLKWPAGFMRGWRNSLNAAEDAALRGLLSARLNYPMAEQGKVEFLEKGLFVESSYIKSVRRIGSGTYGQVDEVVCFGEKYAMKTVHGIRAIEDANEAVIQAKLHHPNIVKLVWYTCNFESRDSLSLLMDLMSCNLEDLMERHILRTMGGLDSSCPLVAVNIMRQIAGAMMYLHSQNVMHRDLKAANVLVDYTSNTDAFAEGYIHVKVADFGFAKVKKMGSKSMNTWKVGSKFWRAPEVFWQEPSSNGSDDHLTGALSVNEQGSSRDDLANYSFSADVYSFAMTCYEIVTGKKPFADILKSGWKERTLKEHIVRFNKRPSLPEELYPRLKELIEKCWDGSPDKRPSFKAICDQLDQIKDELLFGSPASCYI